MDTASEMGISSKTALVTGNQGQIGTSLVTYLVQHGYEVHTLDRKGVRSPNHTVADARDGIAGLIARVRPKLLFHLVAILSGKGEEDPSLCWDVNTRSLQVLLESVAELPADTRPRVVWPSSIAAFGPLPGHGDRGPDVATDDTPLHPRSMYGATKAAGEALGTYYFHRRGVDFRSVRFPGLLSATKPGQGSSDFANHHYFKAAGHSNQTNFADSTTKIPFMYMPDGIRGLVSLAETAPELLSRRVYNIAAFSAGPDDFAESIRRYGDPDFRIDYVPLEDRQKNLDSWPRALDDKAARDDWGWEDRFTLDAMTPLLIDEIKKNNSSEKH